MTKILITGCSSGIGLATAQYLAQQGWQVIATLRNVNDAKLLQHPFIRVKYCDLNKAEEVAALFADPEVQDIDAAFLNAGYGYLSTVTDINREGLTAQLNCNLIGTWDCFSRCTKLMQQQGKGKILVNSSVISFSPVPYRAAYGASKAGLNAMVTTFRIENPNPQIQVSLLHPGPIATKFRQRCYQEYLQYTKEKVTKENPYYEGYLEQETRIQGGKRKRFTLSSEQAAIKVAKILQSKKQKAHYFLCVPTYIMWFAQKLLPYSWFEKFVLATYKLEK